MILQSLINYFRKPKKFLYTLVTCSGEIFTGYSNNDLTPQMFMKKFAKNEYKKWEDSKIKDEDIYWEEFKKEEVNG